MSCLIASIHAARDLEQSGPNEGDEVVCGCLHCQGECDCDEPRLAGEHYDEGVPPAGMVRPEDP